MTQVLAMAVVCLALVSTSCTKQENKAKWNVVNQIEIEKKKFDSDIYRPSEFSDSFDEGNVVGGKPKDIVFGSTTKPEHCIIVGEETVEPNSAPHAIKFQNTGDKEVYFAKSAGEYFLRGEAGWSFLMKSDQPADYTVHIQSFDPTSAVLTTLRFRNTDGKAIVDDRVNRKSYNAMFKLDQWNDVLLVLRADEQQYDLVINGVVVQKEIPAGGTKEHKFSRFLFYQSASTTTYFSLSVYMFSTIISK